MTHHSAQLLFLLEVGHFLGNLVYLFYLTIVDVHPLPSCSPWECPPIKKFEIYNGAQTFELKSFNPTAVSNSFLEGTFPDLTSSSQISQFH